MSVVVGIDISKEKFDACGIGGQGEKTFSLCCSMDRSGFGKLKDSLPLDKSSFIVGMESTASYHLPLFSYLTAEGYRVVIINPLLINSFAKRSLRKTKTDKKDALTIAQFLLREKDYFSPVCTSPLTQDLKDLARRREKLADQVTALKADMKRILSVTFPELERLTGIFTKSTLRLLMQYPSAHALRQAPPSTIAEIIISRSRGRKSYASVDALQKAAAASVGVTSLAKDLILKQEACLLLHLQEQIKETAASLRSLMTERMKQDMKLLSSTKGIGEASAANFLIEMGEG